MKWRGPNYYIAKETKYTNLSYTKWNIINGTAAS